MKSLFACGVDKLNSHHQVNLHGHQNLDDEVGFNYDNNSFLWFTQDSFLAATHRLFWMNFFSSKTLTR
jgi:hypothetical protein